MESKPEGGGDAAVDTLADLLRALGQFSFDTDASDRESTGETFEAWARHLLVGSDPPEGGAVGDSGSGPDWSGIRRFATGHRREECEYVVRSLSDLREALWLFVQGVGRSLPADREGDVTIGAEFERLRETLGSSDTEEIRRAVRESVQVVEDVLRERSVRSEERIEQLSTRVEEFAEQLVQAREQLERDSHTQLYNRGAFDEFLEKMSHLGMLSGRTASLFLIDVDDFKWVNDHFGHPAGDAVLQEISKVLTGCFSRRGDFVARYGGDEFAVVVQTERAQVDQELGEACVLRVRDLEIPQGEEIVRVTVSIGAARLDPGESPEAWLTRADQALYAAKENGRDRFAAGLDLHAS